MGDDDRWATRILVEDPEWFRQYPMSRPLRFLFVDIEQFSEGGAFPKADAPLVSIALGDGSGREPWVVVAKAGADGMPDDARVLEAWRWAVEEHDPDVVVVFNAGYDMMRLAHHGAKRGFPFTEWGRTLPSGERMYSYEYRPAGAKGNDRTLYLGGRIVWDLRKNANSTADYNLAGVKDERLKTIADFLGLPVIKEDTSNTAALWRSAKGRLVRYNANDVVLLEHLARRYLPDRLALAEFYGAPLDMALDAPGGWGGTVASARVLFQQGIVSDGSNLTRHRNFIRFVNHRGEEADADDDDSSYLQFEGAHVALYKRGLHRPLWKVDFASLYPSVMRATRCGPDNTRIVGTRPLEQEPVLRTDRNGDGNLYVYVPDEKYGHTWVIEVRGESVFTPILKARMEDRLKAKRAGDEARANILKTLLNAMFGVHGALSNRYGVFPIAILCTGISRALIREVEDAVGDAKVETDTDGVYIDSRVSAAILTRRVNRVVEDLGFEPCFKLDLDEYAGGYFHEMKTYLLLTTKGKVKRQGVAMKGKALPAAFDRVMEDVGIHILRGEREAAVEKARGFLDLAVFDPRDFVQRARLNKPIGDYASETKEVKIARRYEREYGVEPTVGQTYEYIRVRGGERLPPTDAALCDLDTHYYLDSVVLRALERIGITREELGIQDRVQTLRAQAKRPRGEMTLFQFAAQE